MSGRSREELIEFLEYLEDKGMMPQATVRAKKAAVKKLLGIVDDQEASDVTTIDLHELASRFNNLHGKSYKPDSLQTYVSRVRSAIDDFNRYLASPLNFKPTTRIAAKKSGESSKGSTSQGATDARPGGPGTQAPEAFRYVASSILPIPIRESHIVQIAGLPHDLTEAEAKKIANVIMAMAS